MKRLFSGIQPSGDIHIGNYLGAIRNWVSLQEEYEAIYCVVDLHAITQPYERDEMAQRTLDAAIWVLACGVDPDKATLFVQSDVPEHAELCWMLMTQTPMGDLSRMTQFKEKSKSQESVNAGLFTYPVLQTADILLYKAEAVPVGDDQVQHLELAREIVRKFNARFGPTFPEPKAVVPPVGRIIGLDGDAKMSKSKGNTVAFNEDADAIWKKLAPAVTDTNRVRLKDPGDPDKCNIFTLHTCFAPKEIVDDVAAGCRGATRGCFACKKILHQHMMAEIGPIQERAAELRNNPDYVRDVLSTGAARCRGLGHETLEAVRGRMGLLRAVGMPES